MKESPFSLDLFDSYKDIVIFAILIIILFSYNIFQKYELYKEIKSSKFYTTDARVLKQYKKSKNGKTYNVLKIRSDDGYSFYTTNYEDIKDLTNRDISVGFITDKIGFRPFLGGFYAPSFDIRLFNKRGGVKQTLENFIKGQHKDPKIVELFLALFLAEPISKELRDDVSNLGISHLIAISGFHLGVLFFILYFLISYIYTHFQDRYFPYRNRRFDLSILIFILLFAYMGLLGYVPSVVRAFVMMVFGFFLYHRSFKILSFEVLSVSVIFILALIPEFIFSVGFWFSVSGVFYIYLFLHHFSHLKNWQIFILLNFWVYFAMLPIVHYIFGNFTLFQLFSPLITMVFSLFYPIEMLLHIFGFGGLIDDLILKLFSYKTVVYEIKTPLWFLIIYIAISILAIFSKRLIFLILLFDLIFFMLI